MNVKKSLILLAIGLGVMVFLSVLFCIFSFEYEISPYMYTIKLDDSNISEINPLIDYLELYNVSNIKEISLLVYLNKPNVYNIKVSYFKHNSPLTKNLYQSDVDYESPLYNSIEFIKENSPTLKKDDFLNILKKITLFLLGVLVVIEFVLFVCYIRYSLFNKD